VIPSPEIVHMNANTIASSAVITRGQKATTAVTRASGGTSAVPSM